GRGRRRRAARRGARRRALDPRRRRRGRAQPGRHRAPRLRGAGTQPHAAYAHARRRVPRAHGRAHHPRRRGVDVTAADIAVRSDIRPRPAGFLADTRSMAGRALRAVPREPEFLVPALVVPVFFYFVNIGALQNLAQRGGGVADFKAFQLPVAIIFAVTGISRASALVTDIQDGYFDRLLVTPIRRLSLLLGLMVADLAVVVALSCLALLMGFAVGVHFGTGVVGVLVFVLMGG